MYKIFIICYLFVFIAFFRHYFFSGFFLCFSLFIKIQCCIILPAYTEVYAY